MKEDNKIEPPVYLSVKKLEKVFSLIAVRSMTSFNPAYFVTHSFASSDANLAIAALRFLGLIDNNSNSTSLMTKMGYKGGAKKEALAEMVKIAYGKLFENVPEAYAMDKDELHNDFMHIYKISARVASGAVPAFVYLCEQAGLREIQGQSKTEKTPVPISKKTTNRESVQPKRAGVSIETDYEHTVIPFGESGIKLVLPTDVLTNISLLDDYKGLISSITAFSDKYFKSKDKNKDDGTASEE